MISAAVPVKNSSSAKYKAARWIVTHLDLVGHVDDATSQSALLLLGRTFAQTGQHEKACQVFEDVLADPSGLDDYWQALQYLVNTRIEQDRPIAALHILSGNHPWPLTQGPDNEIALMKARVYCSMGLIGRASGLLTVQLRLMPERQQRAKAYFELGTCAAAVEDHEAARRYYSEVLVLSEPGLLVTQAAYGLAQTCVALQREEKALALCRQVLSSQPPETLRFKTLKLISEIHTRNEKYEQAVQALLEEQFPYIPEPAGPPVETSTQTVVSKNG